MFFMVAPTGRTDGKPSFQYFQTRPPGQHPANPAHPSYQRAIRYLSVERPPRSLCRPRRPYRICRTQPRFAILHLAQRHFRPTAVQPRVPCRRTRRARTPAVGRQQHARIGRPPARPRQPSQYRSAPVQPLRLTKMACTRLPDRLPPPQPPHAQQILYRRQPRHHTRRTQYRRRILQSR